jgi:hypothetical protein
VGGEPCRLGAAHAPPGPATHVVEFYGSEDELAGSVSRYLAEGLGAGEIAITIATDAQARGDYVVLDAAEMLRLVMIGDRPDPAGFRRQRHTSNRLVAFRHILVVLSF